MPDLEEGYAARVAVQRMFDDICKGTLQTFHWPFWYLKQIMSTDKDRYEDKIRLKFNCFEEPVVIDVSGLRDELSLTVSEKYQIVGNMAGRLLEMRCNEAVPSNVELGEN